jgi:hypothetical protein
VEAIDREGRFVVLKFRPQARLDPVRLVKVVHDTPGALLAPPASMKLDLDVTAGAARSTSEPRGGHRSGSVRQRAAESSSWWTTRAKLGEVAPGFTKEEILRRPEQNPRLEGGVFDRLQGVLRALGPS